MKAYESKYELEFISGRFLTYELPDSKKYLFKYFKSKIQRIWLRYYLLFKSNELFFDHTGMYSSTFYPNKLAEKLHVLESAYEQAMKTMDVLMLGKIKSGKMKCYVKTWSNKDV